jgi:hypothetical protein
LPQVEGFLQHLHRKGEKMKNQSICLVIVIVLLCPSASTQWVQTNGLQTVSVAHLAVSGSNLIAANGDAFYLTTDNGDSWTQVSSGLSTLSALAANGTNLFAGSSTEGVFLSTDNGSSWVAVNTGLTCTRVRRLAVSGANIYAAALQVNGYLFLSTNNGTDWITTGWGDLEVNCLVASGSNVYGGAQDYYGFARSTDEGTTWTRSLNAGLPSGPYVVAIVLCGTNLFASVFKWTEAAGYPRGAFLSTNNGDNWTSVGLADEQPRSFAVSGTSLFAASFNGGVFLTTDNGTNWSNTNLICGNVRCLAVSGDYLFAGTTGYGVWRVAISDIIVPITLYSFSAMPLSQIGYVGIEWKTTSEINNYGFLVEKDTARVPHAFTEIPGSFTPGQGTTLVPHAYTFIDRNVTPGKWTYRLKQIDLDGTVHVFEPKTVDVTTTAVGNNPAVPGIVAMQQNYPNPFNPSTTITYELPKTSVVRLSVFDMLGCEVSVLVNERREAGHHEVKFDGSKLASGVYLYRIQAGSYVETRKLLRVK